jgi:hypothetical protein
MASSRSRRRFPGLPGPGPTTGLENRAWENFVLAAQPHQAIQNNQLVWQFVERPFFAWNPQRSGPSESPWTFKDAIFPGKIDGLDAHDFFLRLDFPLETDMRLSWLTLGRVLVPYIFNDLGYADSKLQQFHHFLGSVGAGLRITFGRFALEVFSPCHTAIWLRGSVRRPLLYITGHIIAF